MTTTQRIVKCKPYIKRLAAPQTSWTIPNLCAAYKWPSNMTGTGTIAIIELGGGWSQSDMDHFFPNNLNNGPLPTITDVSVDGTTNSRQNPPNDADYEVALDIQVAATSYFMATGKPANIRVYWSQNIDTAITAAAKDSCSVCSISWGADEASWGADAVKQLESAAAAAVASGMAIFAASGDNDSSDGGPTAANVDAPASCPHVVGCGGTTMPCDCNAETVWNNNPGTTNGEGTGGGYSTVFPVQSWQIGAPPAPKHLKDKWAGRGRMVPDISGNADPNTGYQIYVYGSVAIVGGTSAVAPLYTGLFAAFRPTLGFVLRSLWKHQGSSYFTDITQGGNGDYSATPGPDPCSGIGRIIGSGIATLFPVTT